MNEVKACGNAEALVFDLPLPANYAIADVLRFHGRDKEQLAEAVDERQMQKGVLLADVPTVIDIRFDQAGAVAHCVVSADGEISALMTQHANQSVLRLLGLLLDPQDFVRFTQDDPVFGPLAQRQSSIRVIQSPTVFEALTWAIMGQQINVAFAVSLRRTFIQAGARRHSSGLWCYPSAADAASIPVETLTGKQFSRAKAETLLRLSAAVASGVIDLEPSAHNTLEKICAALLAVKGIGPWTVNYALLRDYAHADCSLHGDVAVRSGLQRLYGMETRPDMAAAEKLLQQYRPHRTMAAAHLWASLG
ncbi:MAG: DNA-3-methyladenine glycosylase family protein [Janthinobacterium lividum]